LYRKRTDQPVTFAHLSLLVIQFFLGAAAVASASLAFHNRSVFETLAASKSDDDDVEKARDQAQALSALFGAIAFLMYFGFAIANACITVYLNSLLANIEYHTEVKVDEKQYLAVCCFLQPTLLFTSMTSH